MTETLFLLKGKTAFISGGTRGIGLAIAIGMKEAGASVGIHGSKEDATRRIADEHGFSFVFADLKKREERESMAADLLKKLEVMDILVNNAGFEIQKKISEAEETDLEDHFQVNTKSPYRLVQALLPLLRKSASPAVINVTSIHQQVAVRNNGAYCMAKAALEMFTKVAALEFGPLGIRVNNLAPGAIETDMNRELIRKMDFPSWIPLGRVGKTEDLVGPAIFLASGASRYITGATLYVDGGYKENLLRY
ncbi:MAG: SDR family oxidoreductase [Treponema sp.]|jgi:gluconate 5-dehydrogenase|nr:SDR family oxidoreductase [Treponema sp.]